MGGYLGGRAGFVETDMTIVTDPEHLEIDAARLANGSFIARTVGSEILIGNRAVRDVDILGRDIKMVEEAEVHELPVALCMAALESEVLVEIEGDDIGERESHAVQLSEFRVEPDGGAAGRQAENDRAVLACTDPDEVSDFDGEGGRGILGGRKNLVRSEEHTSELQSQA